jgi:hypothetical protein
VYQRLGQALKDVQDAPMEEMDIIHARLKIAEAYAKGLRK